MSAFGKHIITTCFCLWIAQVNIGYSQSEEALSLAFQESFFEGLKEKGIQNYTAAVYHFEKCYALDSASVATSFELSKVFLYLKRYEESKFFIDRALLLSPENKHLKWHRIVLLKTAGDMGRAISELQLLSAAYPKYKDELVLLYLQQGSFDLAGDLIREMEAQGQATRKLIGLKRLLAQKTATSSTGQKEAPETKGPEALRKAFYDTLEYDALEQLLRNLEENSLFEMLEKEAAYGLELYPAQAGVYLFRAKALFQLEKYPEAIDVLDEGVLYIMDENGRLRAFYELYASCYGKMNNIAREKEYKQKAAALRKME